MKIIFYITLFFLATCGNDQPPKDAETPTLKIEKLSPKEFNLDFKLWAEWIDENDTNVGVVDSIYDLKFQQLEFYNDLRLEGDGELINLAPIWFHKSIYLNGFSVETVYDYRSNKNKYGVAFYYKGILNKITVNLKNIENSFSKGLIRVDDEALKDSLFINLNLENITIKNNSNGGIHIRAVCNNGKVSNIKILSPLGYENARDEIKNSGNSYINDTTKVAFYNSGLIIGSRFFYSNNIDIKNIYIEELVIGHDATTFNNGGGKSRHTTGLMFAGNNCSLTNYRTKNVERPLYLRGNNFTVKDFEFDNSEYPASYFIVHKGKRDSIGVTNISKGNISGLSEALFLFSSTDSTTIKNVDVDIQPKKIAYKLNDSLVISSSRKSIMNEGIFRDEGGSILFQDMNIKTGDIIWPYYFIGMTGSGNNSLYFKNITYSGNEINYFFSAKKFNKVEVSRLGIYGKLFSVSETKELRVNDVYPIERNGKDSIFNIVYLTNVNKFILNNNEIKTKDSILNRIKIAL